MLDAISGWNTLLLKRVGMWFSCSAFLLCYLVKGSSQRWRQTCTISQSITYQVLRALLSDSNESYHYIKKLTNGRHFKYPRLRTYLFLNSSSNYLYLSKQASREPLLFLEKRATSLSSQESQTHVHQRQKIKAYSIFCRKLLLLDRAAQGSTTRP